jgi:hypothetical protein
VQASLRRRAGHPEVIGEHIAKLAFFEAGWNPYSRFLDVEKIDLVLRRGPGVYREVQVKFGKLFRTDSGWQKGFYDVSSWRPFGEGEFDGADPGLFIAYVLSEDDGYRGDIFLFPVRDFAALLREAPKVGGAQRHVYLSRCLDGKRWVLRKTKTRVEALDESNCVDVTRYRRNFAVLDGEAPASP